MEKFSYTGLFLFDGLSCFFLVVIALVSIPSAIFSIGYLSPCVSKIKFSLANILLVFFVFSMSMVVTSGNLFSFLVFWELMSLSSYFLVVFEHTHQRCVRAGTIYLVMTHMGTAFLIAAFAILYVHAGSFDFGAVKLAVLSMPQDMRNIVFLLLFIGFGTKAGVVPLHIWLPYAHPAAPAHVSSLMSGVMIKIAIYGMIRFFIMLLGVGPPWWGIVILVFGAASCLIGVIYALMDHDLKKLLAYHSVENIGIILLGLGIAMVFKGYPVTTIVLLGMSGALYHLVNHGLFKGLLFLCSGSVAKACGTLDIEKMGGLIKSMPVTAVCFLVGAMGISALPPLNGFVSEWLTFQAFFGALLSSQGGLKIFMLICVAVLALTSGLAAACFVKAFGITFLALPRSRAAQEAKESSLSMKVGMGILAVLVVLFGIGCGLIMPYICQVAQEVLGIENTLFSFNWFSLSLAPISPISISPIIFVFILAAVSLVLLAWFVLSPRKAVPCNTWDCGYYVLGARNEYTATAYSKPFRIAFSFFLLPYRKVEKIRDSFYHVRSFTYQTHTTKIFKQYFYDPLVGFTYNVAHKLRWLQPGSINLYISYIFIALTILILALVIL
ncbi:MAG: proton-conducting transporter membrane subunit [Candidatus Omnitrophota bacterium]|nr:proton-conducting transporter membrane subunit [Candidatus Omnitrophota bacterium]